MCTLAPNDQQHTCSTYLLVLAGSGSFVSNLLAFSPLSHGEASDSGMSDRWFLVTRQNAATRLAVGQQSVSSSVLLSKPNRDIPTGKVRVGNTAVNRQVARRAVAVEKGSSSGELNAGSRRVGEFRDLF